MKVLIVIGQLGVGGGERQLYLLLKGLNHERFKPIVVSMNPGRDDFWEKPIIDLGITIRFVQHSPNKLKRLYQLYGCLKAEKPDLIVSWTLHLNFFVGILGRLAGVSRTFGSIRNDLFNPMKKYRWLQRFFGTKGVDKFIANSTKGRYDLVTKLKIDSSKVTVIFNAVTLGNSNLSSIKSKADVLQHLDLPSTSMILVSVGRLELSKNPELLLRVMRRVLDKLHNVILVYIGEGPQKEILQHKAKKLGIDSSVYFAGKLPVAIQYLHAFDILCHCGVADGMPNVVLEGSAVGLPVVSTRVNGAEDIIQDGVTGYLVEINNDEKYAARVLELLLDPAKRKKFGNAGKLRAQSDQFSESTMVQQFESLFNSATI